MKKTIFRIVLPTAVALLISSGITSCKKKMTDADVKSAIETALKADPMAANTMISVEKGVATVSGVCKDEMCKTHCAELVKGIKGVKEVVNNCTVAAAPLPPVVNADDDALGKGLVDALKDMAGVNGSVTDGKIVLTGEIAKAKWVGLKQLLDKLKSKGYDLSGLKIN